MGKKIITKMLSLQKLLSTFINHNFCEYNFSLFKQKFIINLGQKSKI